MEKKEQNQAKVARHLIIAERVILAGVAASALVIVYFLAVIIADVTLGKDISIIELPATNMVAPRQEPQEIQQASVDPKTVDYTQYFTSTNPVYTDRFQGDLAQMAINLNYFDFDRLIADLYNTEAGCNPVEAMDGSTTYDLSFQTGSWQVELSTLMDNETCLVTSWIDLYSLEDDGVVYEYQSAPARLKPSNYVTNLPQRSTDGTTRLFTMERGAFADFIVLVRSGGLNQGIAVPFDLAKLSYQKISTPPNPAE